MAKRKTHEPHKALWIKGGTSPNPKGGPALPPEVKVVRAASRESLIRVLENCVNADKEKIIERLNDPKITLIEESFLRASLGDLQKGSTDTVRHLIERIYGRTIQPVVAAVGVKTLEELLSASNGEDVEE